MRQQISVTVDVTLYRMNGNDLELLLIRRGREPFKGTWAMPGGFVDTDEPLIQAACRELEEETSMSDVHLEQMCTVGTPGRDPRGRIVTVVYLGLTNPASRQKPCAGDDAKEARWFKLGRLPQAEEMASDHREIIESSKGFLKELATYPERWERINLVDQGFTPEASQKLREAILSADHL